MSVSEPSKIGAPLHARHEGVYSSGVAIRPDSIIGTSSSTGEIANTGQAQSLTTALANQTSVSLSTQPHHEVQAHQVNETQTTADRIKDNLTEKVLSGIESWDELLSIVEAHPSLFERVYIDLDDTVFTTKVYVGSEEWFRDEMHQYNKSTSSLRASKLSEEDRLIDNNLYRATEASLPERLAELKQQHPHIKIIGLTARDLTTKPRTEQILTELKINIPVIYAGTFHRKKSIFLNALTKRNNEIETENHRRLQETQSKLQLELGKAPTEEDIIENTPLVSKGMWVFVDDRMSHIFRNQNKLASLASERTFCIEYKISSNYNLQDSFSQFGAALQADKREEAIAHGIDMLTLAKSEQDVQVRRQLYLNQDVQRLVRGANNSRLTMAYVESVSDFLAKKMDTSSELGARQRDDILNAYFELVTPFNKELFISAYKSGSVSVSVNSESNGGFHSNSSYEIVIDENNCYIFLEPLLRYLRQEKPDVVVLPDTGARPFQRLITHFLEKEGLQTQVVLFPISRNTAADTLYEVRRWMKLLKEEIPAQTDEDINLVAALRQLNLHAIETAKKVVVLDDNITSGKTMEIIQEVLKSEYGVEPESCLSPFAFRSPENYTFPVLSTFQISGNYSWKLTPPPLAVRTAWEYDNGQLRGAQSRKRFALPPGIEKKSETGEQFRERLFNRFKLDYEADHAGLTQREVPATKQAKLITISAKSSESTQLNGEPGKLPDLIELDSSTYLCRRIGTVPEWILQEQGFRQDDIRHLGNKNIFYYDIQNLDGQILGAMILAQVSNEAGKTNVVVKKVQPVMACEHLLDSCKLTENFVAHVNRNQNSYGVNALYIDSNEVTMVGLSESHRVRRELRDKYSFLSREETPLFLGNENSDWVGEVNILWKKLIDEEIERNLAALACLEKISKISDTRPILRLLEPTERRRFDDIKQLLLTDLPLQESDLSLLKLMTYYKDAVPEGRLNEDELEKVRTKCRFRMLVEESDGSEEDIRFPDGYFTVANPRVRELRIQSALGYFFNNLWDNGSDLSSISGREMKECLSQYGLAPVYNQFKNHREFLEYLAPGCYSLAKGNAGYQPNAGAEVRRENFERYLNGEWWAVAPGMKYTINGDEQVPPRVDIPSNHFRRFSDCNLHFEADINYRLIARLTRDLKDLDIIYFDEDRVTNVVKTNATEPRNLGWLDILQWAKQKNVTARNHFGSCIIAKVNSSGEVFLKRGEGHLDRGVLAVGRKYIGMDVIGILVNDRNHGVILEWREYNRKCKAVGEKVLNTLYFEDGVLRTLNIGGAEGRTAGFLDIVQWMQGNNIYPRSDRGSHVIAKVNSDGRVFVHKIESISSGGCLTVGKKHVGKNVLGILVNDDNHGVLLEWHEYEPESRAIKDETLNVTYFKNGILRALNANATRNRTLGYLDIAEWAKGKKITPREDRKSFILGKVYPTGNVFIGSNYGQMNWLYLGKQYVGMNVIGTLIRDINQGTIVEWHEYDPETKAIRGETLDITYFDNGEAKPLNGPGVKNKRTVGFLDVVRWSNSINIVPRKEDKSCVLSKVKSDGQAFISYEGKLLIRGGCLTVGKRWAGKDVIGILVEDQNHGVVLEWREYKAETGKPLETVLNVNYLDGEEIKTLNPATAENRSLGHLDIARWLSGKEIKPRNHGLSSLISTVHSDGRVSIDKNYRLNIGTKNKGKEVIGTLDFLPGLGNVLGWFEYDPQTQKAKGELLKAHKLQDGQIIDVTKEVSGIFLAVAKSI